MCKIETEWQFRKVLPAVLVKEGGGMATCFLSCAMENAVATKLRIGAEDLVERRRQQRSASDVSKRSRICAR